MSSDTTISFSVTSGLRHVQSEGIRREPNEQKIQKKEGDDCSKRLSRAVSFDSSLGRRASWVKGLQQVSKELVIPQREDEARLIEALKPLNQSDFKVKRLCYGTAVLERTRSGPSAAPVTTPTPSATPVRSHTPPAGSTPASSDSSIPAPVTDQSDQHEIISDFVEETINV